MLAKSDLNKMIAEVVANEGFKLYELQYNPGKSKNLQVFVTSTVLNEDGKKTGVIVSDCAKLSRKIQNLPELESFFEQFGLEVSSPGVERKLRCEEHFEDAVGEEVKLVFKFGDHSGNGITGRLAEFSDGEGVLSHNQQETKFKYIDIKSAKVVVDYKSLLSAGK